MLPWPLVKLGGSWKAQLPASFPTLQPWMRCLSQTAFLITGTRHGACSSVSGGLQFPASPWNYSNKPSTSSHATRGYPILLSLQISFNGTCSFILSECTLCGPVWQVVSLPLGLWVCVSTSPVQGAGYLAILITLKQESLHQQRKEEVNKHIWM